MSAEMAQKVDIIDQTLVDILSKEYNTEASVGGLTRLKGGFSREIWSFDVQLPGRSHELILCKDSGKGAVEKGKESLDRVQEFQLLKHLKQSDVPVPGVVCANSQFGETEYAYIIMERVAGDTDVLPLIKDPLYISQHQDFSRQMASILLAIHVSPISREIFPNDDKANENIASREIERWTHSLQSMPGSLTPTLLKALNWLHGTTPPKTDQLALVHGDYRVGNLIYGNEGIRTVLDWEMAHIGDPLEDVSWAQLPSWTGKPGGLVECDDWCNQYAEVAGHPIDVDALRVWDVISAIKMSCLAHRASIKTSHVGEVKFLQRLIEILRNDLETRLLIT